MQAGKYRSNSILPKSTIKSSIHDEPGSDFFNPREFVSYGAYELIDSLAFLKPELGWKLRDRLKTVPTNQ
jgi:hypothetical protein